jgi:hypothetical protein
MTFPISKEQKEYAKIIGRSRHNESWDNNHRSAYDEKKAFVVNCQGALGEVLFADHYSLARPVTETYLDAKQSIGDVAGYEIKARINDYIKQELWINCADVDNVPSKPVVLIKIDKDYETYRYLGWIWSDELPNLDTVRREINQHNVWVYRLDATLLLPVDILPLPTDGGF